MKKIIVCLLSVLVLFACSAPGGSPSIASYKTGELTKEALDGTTWIGGSESSFVAVKYVGEKLYVAIGFSEKNVMKELDSVDNPAREYSIDVAKQSINVPLMEGRARPYILLTFVDDKTLKYEQIPANIEGEHKMLSLKK